MNDTVWISTAIGHASNLRPMTHSFSLDEKSLERAFSYRRGNQDGEPLSEDCFPDEVFGTPDAKEADYKLPELFFAGSYWVVSAKAADVLRRFDLGEGGLYPVKVSRNDRQTPIGDGWFCINFGNRKSGILPEASPKMRSRYIRAGEKGWFPPFVTKDADIAVAANVLGGPDLWIDPQVGDAFFISGSLRAALKQDKADKGFFLSQCRVIAG
jgi:hypothetical protein